MPPNAIPIPIFTTSQGHRSIAEAAQQFLHTHHIHGQVEFIEEAGLPIYSFAYKYLPQYYDKIYALSKQKIADFALDRLLILEHERKVRKVIDQLTPTFVINTSFGFTPALEKAKKITPFTFINIVPNPRTFFNQDVEVEAEVLCVFDERTEKDARSINKHSEIIQTGWFVRPEFEQDYEKDEVRMKLQLALNTPTILFVTGSEGTHASFQLIEAVSHIPNQQIIIACGRDASLLKKAVHLSQHSNAHIIPLPFTKEIYAYMQAADLVIGKAGPNMLFESIATHTPFFAISHVGGLEDGNLEIIKEYDVGDVEENPVQAEGKLKRLIDQPDTLKMYLPQVKKLAEFNRTQRKNLLSYLQ